MRQYISQLMPLIVEALLDGAAITKYEVVVSTLGQVIQSTGFKLFKILFDKFLVCNVHGYVITPYNEYPQLLGFLLKLLNGELAWSTRREVLKVLGIMGALDPHVHKHNQQSLPGSHGEVTWVTGDPGQHIRSMDELPTDLWPSFATFEDYFSTSMGLACVPYLPKVFPDLYHIVWICEGGLKEFITWKLGTLVSIARQRSALFEILESILSTRSLEGLRASQLACRFRKATFASTELEALGYSPDESILQKF
ncbi:hypothetical protein KY284_037610 [Solanum tuberosum]|nr:hypothetical protein KY284_037610 [Solanum tuberosum]